MKTTKKFWRVLYEVEDSIATATIDFQERLNALGWEVRSGLVAALEEAEKDDIVRVVILTGAGRAFCAGADLKEMGLPEEERGQIEKNSPDFWTVFRRFETISKPVIAAVNGIALAGGTEITLSCDYVIASDKAIMGVTEPIVLAVPPGWANIRLATVVGLRKAKEILMFRRELSAEEAMQYGLVNRVVPHDRLMQAVREMAQHIIERAPLAIAAIKSMNNSFLSEKDILHTKEVQGRLAHTEDRKEAYKAFWEKRKPVWKGR